MADKKSEKKLMVQYADEGAKQHDFSKDRDLKQHTAQLCKLFGIQDSPEPFVISVRQNGQHYKYLSQQDIDSGITTTPDTTFVLRAPFKLVDEVIRDLQNPSTKKHTVFNLSKKYLKDGQVVSEFLQREGNVVLEELVKTESGGTLAFSLQALDAVMAYGKGAYVVTDELVERIVAYLLDQPNIQVKINSLRVCKHLIASEKGGGFWMVHRELVLAAKKRHQQPYEAIISALKNEDLNIKVGALNVINAFIEHSPDKATFEEFLVLIESFGYLEELKAQLVTVQSTDFKQAVYWHQVAKSEHWGQEKNIPYDKENSEHETFLYDLWGTCFPETKLEQRVSDQWKKLGFQGKDPATDFRGMGLLGLKHILYFAKTYTKIFVDMSSIQHSRESQYYPVSTAGINISSMLLEILDIGKGKKDSAVVGGVVTGGGSPGEKDKEGEGEGDVEGPHIFPILFDHHNALEEMYCLVFRMFNRVWDEMNADYMDFMNVASSVKEMVVQALTEAEDLSEFARSLRVSDYAPNKANRPPPRESSLLDMAQLEGHCKKSKSTSRGGSSSSTRSPGSSSAKRKSVSSSSAVNSSVSAESLALASDNVNLDIFVQIANSSTHVTVPRSVLVKEAIELTLKGLKKKVTKKAKKSEPQHLFHKGTGIWLEDQRAVWTYLLKDNEKLELKTKSSANSRKAEIQVKLECGTSTQSLEYVPETTVRGVIQIIEKPNKSIVKDIHLYGVLLGPEGSGSWLEESRTLTSYGLSSSNSKLVFALRSSVVGGNVTKKRAILLRVQTEMGTKTMQFDENNKAHDVISRICLRMSLDPDEHCLYLVEQNKYMADELPISSYAVTPTQSIVLRQKGAGWLPDGPVVNLLGIDLGKITFRCISSSSSSPPPFSKWGVEEVCGWLKEIGMEGQVVECFEKGKVDGKGLGEVTSGSLRELGVSPLGTRKEIVRQMVKMIT